TTCPFPIRFNSLSVLFNNPNYNSLCVVNGANNSDVSEEGDLYLEPKKIKKITFTFTPLPEDVGKHIEVFINSAFYSKYFIYVGCFLSVLNCSP
ncbi:Hypothetical predicted protein, partial [Paramuricea clavata]